MDSSHANTEIHRTNDLVLNTPANRPPLSAQESREKRLAHQQSRFRNRGGIFVIPERSTNLVDDLIRKTNLKPATARRSRSRSKSHSPIRRKSGKAAVGDHDETHVLSRARKGPKSAIAVVADEDEPIAGPSKTTQATAASKQQKKHIAARKKSTAKKSTHGATTDSNVVAKLPIVLSNARTPRISTTDGKVNDMLDTETQDVSKPGKSSKKAKATSATTVNRKGEATRDLTEEGLKAAGKQEKGGRTLRSKTGVAKPRGKKTSQTRSRTTHDAAVAPTLMSSDNNQDSDASDSINYPSSPLARKGKRRAATNSKKYVEDDTEQDEEDSRPSKTPSKSKAKAPASKQSKKSTKQQQPSAMKEDTKEQPRMILALTPVPEESEPDSEVEHESLVARLAQDLASAISKTVENFAPVSKDEVEISQANEQGSTVGKRKAKRKSAADRKEKEIVVKDETKAAIKKGGKDLVSAKEKSKEHSKDDVSVLKDTENPKPTRSRKGRNQTKTNSDHAKAETSPFSSPSRLLKRARPVIEPELESVDDATSSRTRKKAKMVEADVLTSKSGKAKPPGNKDAPGGTENFAWREGNNASQKKQNKRKRADLTAKADNDDKVELELDLKKKKRKEEKDSQQIAQEKGFNSGSHPPR
ncbi:hypothetical protein DFJ43DRAFT_544572 [Lentinula guzmanii]|uniref:Uncharacterized protein n=1 Tax=Lentinula guzmanii TaxID=2804957 RepID=A0AA38MY09_9AGAR|nr:hypothetical protein DFJ43DRAFT_544572 [Lentinula guzmanii]